MKDLLHSWKKVLVTVEFLKEEITMYIFLSALLGKHWRLFILNWYIFFYKMHIFLFKWVLKLTHSSLWQTIIKHLLYARIHIKHCWEEAKQSQILTFDIRTRWRTKMCFKNLWFNVDRSRKFFRKGTSKVLAKFKRSD